MSNTAVQFSTSRSDKKRSFEAKLEAMYRKQVRRDKYGRTSK